MDCRVHRSPLERMWNRCTAIAALLPVMAGGCGSTKDRPPPVQDCPASVCGSDAASMGSGGAPTGTGGSTTTGGAGTPSGGVGGSVAAGTLSGAVKIYSNALFIQKLDFTGGGTISLTGTKTATGTMSAGTWSVSGAEASATLWAALHATATPDAMDTLEIVDGTRGTADVVFASKTTMDDIVGGLSSTQSLVPTGGHVVFSFVDSANKPLSGVKLALAQSGASIAYDAGDSYADAQGPAPLGATQARGVAIVFNYPAAVPPGADYSIGYVKPGSNTATTVSVKLAQGTVTFRTVAVP